MSSIRTLAPAQAASLPRASTRKASWSAGAVCAKRFRAEKTDRCCCPIASAVPQDAHMLREQQPAHATLHVTPGPNHSSASIALPPPSLTTVPAAPPPAAAAAGPVLVSFTVAGCRTAYGDHLRVAGSCPELGGWSLAAAPALQWREEGGGVWAGTVALPPGSHELKLVRCGFDGSGGEEWEQGGNRAINIPELAGSAPGGGPMLRASCQWDDTSATEVVADRAQLQAVADAAAARVADLARRKAELAVRLAALEVEVAESEAKIASTAAGAQKLVDAELARRFDHRRPRTERLEVAARAAELRSKQTSLVQAVTSRLKGAAAAAAAAAGTAAAPVPLLAGAAGPAVVHALGDGSLQFCFAEDVSAAAAGAREPTALDLAKRQLAVQLPAAAAAALERRLLCMNAQHAQHAQHSSSSGETLGVAAPALLVSSAVSAAGLAGVAAAAPAGKLRLARQVSMLRQEVAAGARQAANLSEDFALLLSLGGPRGSNGSGGRTIGSGKGRQPAPKQPQALQRSGTARQGGMNTVPSAVAAAGTTTALATVAAPAVPAADVSPSNSHGGGSSGQPACPTPALPAAAARLQQQPAFTSYDVTTRASFPLAAAILAAEGIFAAGQLLWGVSVAAVPRPARGAASAAFWTGYLVLTTLPLMPLF